MRYNIYISYPESGPQEDDCEVAGVMTANSADAAIQAFKEECATDNLTVSAMDIPTCLANEYTCGELLGAYIMRECSCEMEEANEMLWDAMEYLDKYLHGRAQELIDDSIFDYEPPDEDYKSCKDCPDDECTGHRMSCGYRS